MHYSSRIAILGAEQKDRVLDTPGIRRAAHMVLNHLPLHSTMWDTICCWANRQRWCQGGCFLLGCECSRFSADHRQATRIHLHRSDPASVSHLRHRRELFSSVTLCSDKCRSPTLLLPNTLSLSELLVCI